MTRTRLATVVTPLTAVVCLAACLPPHGGSGKTAAWISDTSSYGESPAPSPTPAPAPRLADPYREVAAKIIAVARADRGAYAKLAELTDGIGARLAGSPELDRAIAWAVKTMQADGHEVRTEKVMVPHWVRGHEEAQVVAPLRRPLAILGLGGSVATAKGGLTAPVVVVRSFDELEANAAKVKGAIVLYDVAMPAWSDTKGPGYGQVVPYRVRGASRAAKLGAVGVLVRSLTAHSLKTPHTGAVTYDPEAPKIPAAAVTVEDALLIARLAAQGPVTVRLRLDAKLLPDAPSANVLGELRGSERPDEIVVIGAHLDSWDVGQGAHDDGGGCAVMMQTLTVLRRLGLRPKRTIRVVLFTNEENGVRGAKAYAEAHAAELPRTVFALEMDFGAFAPRGFGVQAGAAALPHVTARLAELLPLLAPLGVTRVLPGMSGADVAPMAAAGVPAFGLYTDGRTYFDLHHTEADTLDKVDPQDLADNVAAVAVLAYIAAELPGRFDAPITKSGATPAAGP